MRNLSANEVNSISGALEYGQISYLTTMAAQALSTLTLQGAMRLANRTPTGFAFSYVVYPGIQILGTALGSEFFNHFIAPNIPAKS